MAKQIIGSFLQNSHHVFSHGFLNGLHADIQQFLNGAQTGSPEPLSHQMFLVLIKSIQHFLLACLLKDVCL